MSKTGKFLTVVRLFHNRAYEFSTSLSMFGNLKFISEEYNLQYFKKGYLTVPFLNSEQLVQLAQIFHSNFNIDSLPAVYNTITDVPIEKVKAVNEEISQVCENLFNAVLHNFRMVGSIFMVKKTDENSQIGAHIDGSMTSAGYNNIGVWIPLCDIDEQTGKFCILSNSHHFLPPYNTTFMPHPYLQLEHFVDQNLTCLSLKAGEAIFFNNSILHCTQRNISGNTRIAVLVKLIDKNAPLVTAYYDETAPVNNRISLYQHEENLFLPGAFKSSKPPSNSRFIGYVPELPKIFTEMELAKLVEQYSL